jgi:hypothetical protein
VITSSTGIHLQRIDLLPTANGAIVNCVGGHSSAYLARRGNRGSYHRLRSHQENEQGEDKDQKDPENAPGQLVADQPGSFADPRDNMEMNDLTTDRHFRLTFASISRAPGCESSRFYSRRSLLDQVPFLIGPTTDFVSALWWMVLTQTSEVSKTSEV